MGVKDLWSILAPFYERKPLYELQGKRVAVDLSCWICEAQNIAEYQVQPRMYLRNLYFRTCYLLLMEVEPVFVLEGKAPELKFDTIAARNEIQFKGAKPKKDGVKTGKDRTRFHFVLRQCEEMLGYMGLACIKGKGEAESLCAYLNEDGLVDGCVSQDSDCFAYGARVVYRNFSISQQGAHAAGGGSVDVYDITKAYENLKFGRNKIVALALLSGCDYSEGVFGVGKDSVMKLFETLTDEEVLDRLRSWRDNHSLFDEFDKKISDKNICTSCGHSGKIQSHTRNGCNECKTTKGCDFSKFKNERIAIKNELNIRSKALKYPDFPNEALITEFLVKKDDVKKLDLKWKQPDLVNFVRFTAKFLDWVEIYSFEKFLPILTRWQLINFEYVEKKLETNPNEVKGILFPEMIKKVRKPKGILSYEIVWHDKENYFKGLIPEEQLLEHKEPDKLWCTIEPQNLVEKAYPQLVEDFLQSKIKPKKTTRAKTKKTDAVDEINDMLQNTSISEPKIKKARKPRKNKDQIGELEDSFNKLNIKENKPKTLDFYFKKAVMNCQKKKDESDGNQVYNDAKNQNSDNTVLNKHNVLPSSTPTRTNNVQTEIELTPIYHKTSNNNENISRLSFSDDMSRFDDTNDSDLDEIIDNIVSRKRPSIIDEHLKALGLRFHETEEGGTNDETSRKCDNRSSFFVSCPVEDDLFEKTFNKQMTFEEADSQEMCDEIPVPGENDLSGTCEENKSCDKSLDFSIELVPLKERVNKVLNR